MKKNTITQAEAIALLEKRRAYNRDYQKLWREKNRDKVNDYAARWRKDNIDKAHAYERAYSLKISYGRYCLHRKAYKLPAATFDSFLLFCGEWSAYAMRTPRTKAGKCKNAAAAPFDK